MRKVLAIGSTIALTLTLVVADGGIASAAKPTITAVGDAACSGIASGRGKLKPGLTATPAPGTGQLQLRFKMSNCGGTTGNPNVAPVSAKVTITSTTSMLGCTGGTFGNGGFFGGPATATIKWKATGGRMNPTHIAWATHSGGHLVPNNVIYNHFPGIANTGVITGSYAGNLGAVLQVVYNETPAAMQAACASKKGLKKLTVTGSRPIVEPFVSVLPTLLSIFPNP
jgi:hypothetical protein